MYFIQYISIIVAFHETESNQEHWRTLVNTRERRGTLSNRVIARTIPRNRPKQHRGDRVFLFFGSWIRQGIYLPVSTTCRETMKIVRWLRDSLTASRYLLPLSFFIRARSCLDSSDATWEFVFFETNHRFTNDS